MSRAVFLPTGRFRPRNEPSRMRVGVAMRTLAAVIGGYVLASLAAALLGTMLPMERVDAVMTGTMVALLVFPCAVMWSFAARSAARAWAGLAVPIFVLGAVFAFQWFAA
ncbi:hypothetical protein [Piscinibacter gummiphilus]|uniref:Iron transporter n=1 Tax=Piscinibacter gummiphilus TaxID=946333 RepID=A0A1W6LB01_9BURK|nr:hypothetical protein [Piscinibacter gummiphilus]ARN21465.1 hypothetical protein A4W93_17035 [Piscinibacter gummiphilus]ATU66146.1 iron transporter [Piscinibacter gummiphilus]